MMGLEDVVIDGLASYFTSDFFSDGFDSYLDSYLGASFLSSFLSSFLADSSFLTPPAGYAPTSIS